MVPTAAKYSLPLMVTENNFLKLLIGSQPIIEGFFFQFEVAIGLTMHKSR